MTVEITFEPSGLSGLVAEGSNLWDSARRMGVPIPADCGGRGECTSCQILLELGASLCNAPANAEQTMLGPDRLSSNKRLACQVRIDRPGEVRVRIEAGDGRVDANKDLKQRFNNLKLGEKVATLMELEAVTMIEALDAIAEKPIILGQRWLDRIRGRKPTEERQQAEKQALPPDE